MNRTRHTSLFFLLSLLAFTSLSQEAKTTRQIWLDHMDKISRPVLSNLAEDQLKAEMPVNLPESSDNPEHRAKVAYLEALGRTLCGIAPWLNGEGGTKDEIALRKQYREWTLKAIANATDSTKNDYMVWEGGQPLVDASFFAQALIRCPWLWENLDETTKQNVVYCLKKSRATVPYYSNWILFSSMVEAFFCKYDLPYDPVRIEYGFREFSQHWYVGDGLFSDGNKFALDYYNSYVIQPYLMDIMDAVGPKDRRFNWFKDELSRINSRFAEIQERSINPDGTFPAYGRSIVYRTGAFHHLANMALLKRLPESLSPAQVRSGLTAVMDKVLSAPGTFTEDGWLTIGLYGKQHSLADFYNNTGSLYLCSAIFLPLGLPADDPFWTAPDEAWSSKKIWSGEDVQHGH